MLGKVALAIFLLFGFSSILGIMGNPIMGVAVVDGKIPEISDGVTAFVWDDYTLPPDYAVGSALDKVPSMVLIKDQPLFRRYGAVSWIEDPASEEWKIEARSLWNEFALRFDTEKFANDPQVVDGIEPLPATSDESLVWQRVQGTPDIQFNVAPLVPVGFVKAETDSFYGKADATQDHIPSDVKDEVRNGDFVTALQVLCDEVGYPRWDMPSKLKPFSLTKDPNPQGIYAPMAYTKTVTSPVGIFLEGISAPSTYRAGRATHVIDIPTVNTAKVVHAQSMTGMVVHFGGSWPGAYETGTSGLIYLDESVAKTLNPQQADNIVAGIPTDFQFSHYSGRFENVRHWKESKAQGFDGNFYDDFIAVKFSDPDYAPDFEYNLKPDGSGYYSIRETVKLAVGTDMARNDLLLTPDHLLNPTEREQKRIIQTMFYGLDVENQVASNPIMADAYDEFIDQGSFRAISGYVGEETYGRPTYGGGLTSNYEMFNGKNVMPYTAEDVGYPVVMFMAQESLNKQFLNANGFSSVEGDSGWILARGSPHQMDVGSDYPLSGDVVSGIYIIETIRSGRYEPKAYQSLDLDWEGTFATFENEVELARGSRANIIGSTIDGVTITVAGLESGDPKTIAAATRAVENTLVDMGVEVNRRIGASPTNFLTLDVETSQLVKLTDWRINHPGESDPVSIHLPHWCYTDNWNNGMLLNRDYFTNSDGLIYVEGQWKAPQNPDNWFYMATIYNDVKAQSQLDPTLAMAKQALMKGEWEIGIYYIVEAGRIDIIAAAGEQYGSAPMKKTVEMIITKREELLKAETDPIDPSLAPLDTNLKIDPSGGSVNNKKLVSGVSVSTTADGTFVYRINDYVPPITNLVQNLQPEWRKGYIMPKSWPTTMSVDPSIHPQVMTVTIPGFYDNQPQSWMSMAAGGMILIPGGLVLIPNPAGGGLWLANIWLLILGVGVLCFILDRKGYSLTVR